MMKSSFLLCTLATLLFACGDASSQQSASETTPNVPVNKIYDIADYEETRACTLVSADELMRLAAVPQNAEVMDMSNSKIHKYMGGTCTKAYMGEGGISYTVYIFQSPEDTKMRYDRMTEDMSATEQKQAIGEAMGQVKDQAREEGHLQTDTEEKVADAVGGAIAGGARGTQHETISGIGEEALYEVNNGQLYVRQGNVVIHTSVSSYDESDAARARHRDAAIELAQMVMQAL